MNCDFTDIHCHIIPNVDDGSPDMDTSMLMVELAYQEGIRRMIATPHFGVINPQYDPEAVKENMAALTKEVQLRFPDMQLFLGNELFLAPGYPDGLEDGMSNPLAGSSYVLVEFPMDIEYEFIRSSMRRLLVNGYTPIFAHVERYERAYKTMDRLAELVEMGVLLQVNSHSIVNRGQELGLLARLFGHGAELAARGRLIEEMLRAGLVHFVATDCHYMPGRMPMMRAAAEAVVELVGDEEARRIFLENPELIINGSL